MIHLSRRVSFSMAHRLHNSALSDEQNRLLYGRCNNPNGHGHRYTLQVTVGGEVDPQTGFVFDLTQLDRILHQAIIEPFDHRNFDRDFEEYADVISSGENLVRVFWQRLAPHFPPATPLVGLLLQETEKNSFEYFGGDTSRGQPVS